MARSVAIAVTLLLAVLVPSGCHTQRTLELTPSGAPAFDRFSAEYDIPSAAHHLGRSFSSGVSRDAFTVMEQVSAAEASVQPVSAQHRSQLDALRSARLKIECPFRDGNPAEARLTLSIPTDGIPTATAAAAGHSGVVIRQLVIPRQQVELLILDLARSGYFDGEDVPGARSSLSVTIDGARVSRDWRVDDRLLDFAHRVLYQGQAAVD